MSLHRNTLPQFRDALFLTDGGLETTLVFHEGLPLPHFAAFTLLRDEAGREVLRRYFRRYAGLAVRRGVGLVLETPTWRANPDWGAKLGHDAAALAEVNRRGVDLLVRLRDEAGPAAPPTVISGNLGPRGDGYRAERRMTAAVARDYHAPQIAAFAGTAADLVSAFTLNYVEEAVGIALAARDAGMPAVIAFTVETDGRLPSGQPLGEAIEETDAATGGHPAGYLINCAHPAHFAHVLRDGGAWRMRLRGVRANASRRSHAELDESPDLDIGDPAGLGADFRALRELLPQLTILGGCCGTDHRHIEAIHDACTAGRAS